MTAAPIKPDIRQLSYVQMPCVPININKNWLLENDCENHADSVVDGCFIEQMQEKTGIKYVRCGSLGNAHEWLTGATMLARDRSFVLRELNDVTVLSIALTKP